MVTTDKFKRREVNTCPYCGYENLTTTGAYYLNKDGLRVKDFKCLKCGKFILNSKVWNRK
ncbi:MAG: hypothetical protein LBC39_02675 [Methanobrevibacter sp.]|jgi:DNA-directed RNA polymerase subunit RPC12/RpoP|nr:hypothetical protein [Candidatus Methanovirga aequatorialis]